MSPEEMSFLLAELETMLTEVGLGFLVEQERVAAAEGRLAVDVALPRARSSLEPDPGYQPSAGRPRDGRRRPPETESTSHRLRKDEVKIEPLTPSDRLALLLDLIEVVSVRTVEIEDVVNRELETARHDARVRQDESVKQGRPHGDDRWASVWQGEVVFATPEEAQVTPSEDRLMAQAEAIAVLKSRASDVAQVVDQLREVAGVPRARWLDREPMGRAD